MKLPSWLVGTVERISPQEWLPFTAFNITQVDSKANIAVDLSKLKVALRLPPNIIMSEVDDSNSMDPTIDKGGVQFYIAGVNTDDHRLLVNALTVGDIAVYERTNGEHIIHRIIAIRQDKEGKYYRFKGDNNSVADSDRVRVEHIKLVHIGSIY